ncbi:MAG TPA: ABC transporter ATP-binding protein [Candidatus Limnocylindrales bacterium]|nr:ABC transporter ATP-binding protein [Candidatus Limnocylindrales bacterium]
MNARAAGVAETDQEPTLPAIDVEGVSRNYHLGRVEVRALSAVTLTIARGEMVCVMGRSGSGKSTLLRQLSLIDRPDAGRITIDGVEVTRLPERSRSHLRLAKLGYVFQEYALVPELTAEENVYLPGMMLGHPRGDYRWRARDILGLVGLGDRISHRPRELSGGEQQRVAIARSLINNPSVIFADEPTANLDSISGRTVMETLMDLNRRLSVTVVFVSHDADDRRYAGRVLFLRDGRLAEGF